eukprot:5672299-Pyramimonas_sp.AAC.1
MVPQHDIACSSPAWSCKHLDRSVVLLPRDGFAVQAVNPPSCHGASRCKPGRAVLHLVVQCEASPIVLE